MSFRAAPPTEPLLALHAGLVSYSQAWEWQRSLVARRARDEIGDVVLTLEHPKVITAGRRAEPSHVLWSDEERVARGVEFHQVDRGGEVTYHGPGQLVGYPVLRLSAIRRAVEYVRALEDLSMLTAGDFGVDARRVAGRTGVWVGDNKLVAIGVHVNSRAVTRHGFAFNVTTDLEDFAGIVPCGIADRGVCSLQSLGVEATVADVLARLRVHVERVLGCIVKEAAFGDLGLTPVGPGGQANMSAAPSERREWSCLRSPKTATEKIE
ncbi:MAG: lipoyl(octanoyl) transferase LipB [Actinomycetota bacterium]|nr:lipoyl(octanoyl) transferase LipB [Actinomycetota bacterium]